MITTLKKRIVFGAGMVLGLASAGTAFAQQVEEAPREGIETVVVTAEKRETNLQDTPISMNVLDADDFLNRHGQSLADLGDGSIPSLRVAPFFSRSSALTVGMRGVGGLLDANQPSRDQGVGVYLDGVYLGRAQGLGTALFDVERIEVLKGPQGSLFGRNTEAGAISIVTKRPTGRFGVDARAGVSNYDGRNAAVHLNLPSFANISVKLDAIISSRDGVVENPLDGQTDFNASEKSGQRIEFLWRPNDALSVDYSADFARDATTPYYVQLLAPGSLRLAPLMRVQPEREDSATIGAPIQYSVGKTDGQSLVIGWSPNDDMEIKSISSYRNLKQSQYDNGSVNLSVFAPNANFGRYSLANVKQHQWSEELQLIGELPQIHYVGGLFFYHEAVSDDAWTPNTLRWNATGTAYTVLKPPVAATPFPDRASTAQTDSAGAFGQLTWTPAFLDSRLHLTVGGRYTEDKKQGHLYAVNGALPVVNGVSAIQILDKKWDHFDPMITAALDVTDDVNIYAKYGTGYKAGGANSRSLTYRAFDPESIETVEIGAKTEFADHRIRLNVAAYTGTYKDVQIDFNAVIPGNNRGTLETTNAAGDGDLTGVEADLLVNPIDDLTIGLSVANIDVNLPPAPNPFVTGNPLVTVFPLYAPVLSASLSADYVTSFDWAKLTAHIDANYADGQRTSSSDPTESDTSFIVNGRLALGDIEVGGSRLEVSLWSRNLLDEAHTFFKNSSAALGVFGIYNEPRTYGLDLRVQY